jgi:hypothetical protein
VVAPLDEHHLRLALCHGRLVFLACHGQDGDIVTPTLWVAPAIIPGPEIKETPRHVYASAHDGTNGPGPWTVLEAGEGLRFVYNAACDSGRKADQWERGLAPAEVKTFDRLTTVAEHPNTPVIVMGVAFFDFVHGQISHAPNYELHPVLDIQFP